MIDSVNAIASEDPTYEEIAAALAAIRLLTGRTLPGEALSSRWLKAGRSEAVMPPPAPAGWARSERPR